MKFEFFVSSAVVTAIASIVSAIISQWIARKTAQDAASKEIDKLKLSWEREDIVSSDEEFAEMAKSVAKVIDYCTLENKQDAIGRVASTRSKEQGTLGEALDMLYIAVQSEDNNAANGYLSLAIDIKRSLKLSSCSENCKV